MKNCEVKSEIQLGQQLRTQIIKMKNIWKTKFNPDDELPLNKAIEIPGMIIVVRTLFYENNKYYPQVFFDECLYK